MQIDFQVTGNITQTLELTKEFKDVTYVELLERLNSYEWYTTCGHDDGQSRAEVVVLATGETVAYVTDQMSNGEYTEFE